MRNYKKAFSLIEVIVSAMILSLSVFWIYKLIAENNRIINNSDNFLDANILLTNITNCIENIGYDNFNLSSFKTQTWSFYFQNSLTGKCMTWTYDTNYTFNSVKLNNLDYYLYWKIINSTSKNLDFKIWVYNESVWKIERDYTLWQ